MSLPGSDCDRGKVSALTTGSPQHAELRLFDPLQPALCHARKTVRCHPPVQLTRSVCSHIAAGPAD